MNRKDTDNASANAQDQRSHKPKTSAYISFNREESAALQRLDPRAMWLYFHLKWLSDFKTGKVGGFRKQVLSLTSLAKSVAIPPRQGANAKHAHVDGTEISRILDRLEQVGLVSHRSIDNAALTMMLPMSPIKRERQTAPVVQSESAHNVAVSGQESQAAQGSASDDFETWAQAYEQNQMLPSNPQRLPNEPQKLPSTDAPDSGGFPSMGEGTSGAPSVMTVFNTNQDFSVTAGTPQKFGSDASGTPTDCTDGAGRPHQSRRCTPWKRVVAVPSDRNAALSADEVYAVIAQSESTEVVWLDTDVSRSIYKWLARKGITRASLESVLELLGRTAQVPITPYMVSQEIGKKTSERRNRGGVAL